jgi:hypothetical protein
MREKREERQPVAEIVRKIIDGLPCVIDSMKMDIVNYSALAAAIEDEVIEQSHGRKVNIEAVKMGIVRYAEEIRRQSTVLENEVRDVLAKSVLELKNDVVLLTVRQQPIMSRFDEFAQNIKEGRFFQLTQGTETFTLTVDRKLLDDVITILDKGDIVRTIDAQSAITLISPEKIITTPGVVSYIADLLFRVGVNITQIISCHTDTILVVGRESALKAYGEIEKRILSLRKKE